MKLQGFIFEIVGCRIDDYIDWCSKCPHQADEDGCENKRTEEETEPIYQMMEGRDLE